MKANKDELWRKYLINYKSRSPEQFYLAFTHQKAFNTGELSNDKI